MNLSRMIELTQELLDARGPCGQEEEVRKVVLREIKLLCDTVWIDEAENVIGVMRARKKRGQRSGPIIKVMAHMDELSMSVKRIEENGTLRIRALGGMFPWVFGLGPVEIMADSGILPGVLSVGSQHTSAETKAKWQTESKSLDWPNVHVFTRMSKKNLLEAGVHAGTRVVVAQSRRKLLTIGDCVAGYFLDDRVCITIMLAAAALIRAEKKCPPADVYFVATCLEEIGGGSAAYAAAKLPGAITLAIDVGPVAPEYDTQLTAEPIVVYRDAKGLYSKQICDRLRRIGMDLGMVPQCASLEIYGSDATAAKIVGQTASAGLLCIPTENTHGYEIVQRTGIENCARLLAAYLMKPLDVDPSNGRSLV